LAAIFGKREKDNLNRADRQAISAVVQAYRKELEREFSWRQSLNPSKDRRGGNG
jgi:hypothetical protein